MLPLVDGNVQRKGSRAGADTLSLSSQCRRAHSSVGGRSADQSVPFRTDAGGGVLQRPVDGALWPAGTAVVEAVAMTRPTITAAIIMLNEQRMLPALLR